MEKKRIFLTRALHDFALNELKKRYHVEVHSGRIPIPKTELQSKIKDADGLICFPYDKIDRDVIDSAKNLRVISTYSVGFDHIDTQYAKKKKILIGYTPEILTDATADLAFSLMLDVLRRVSEGDRIIRAGKWRQIYGAHDYVGVDLQGKTLGIFGLGRIGSTLAKHASTFEMKTIYHNRRPVSKKREKSLGVRYVTFNELISQSDIISIHVPHTKETDQLFDKKIFRKMKETAVLVNTARGKIIKETDLITALRKKTIAGAALDVYESEPISKRHPLTKIQNVVLTPHIGSSTKETREKMAEITVKNLDLGINGENPIYSVGH
jgi:glyoxylate reductase